MNSVKASIDLGTNTARLLIGSVLNGTIYRQHISRRITRLGGGFSKEHGISQEAANRAVMVMKEFATTLADFDVCNLRAVATSAVRDAANQQQFCQEVSAATGIDLEVISGHDEARLTLLGVTSGLDNAVENLFVFDVGGGSTEYSLSQNGEILFSKSLPLGVVRLTEGKADLAAMEEKIWRELTDLKVQIEGVNLSEKLKHSMLLGTAGTATTLAAIDIGLIDYEYEKVNNHLLSKATVNNIFSRLLPLTPLERLESIVGLEKGREDLIIAGTLLTLKTMEFFNFPMLKVSDFGLLEGVLLEEK